ncbi:MAG: S8 family serine peptidase [Candidatus Margulisiibacteriota bacterium]
MGLCCGSITMAKDTYRPGEILVKYKANYAPASIKNALSTSESVPTPNEFKKIKGFKSFKEVHFVKAKLSRRLQRKGIQQQATDALDGIYHLQLTTSSDVLETVHQLKQEAWVEWAQPNFVYYPTLVPDDTYYATYQSNMPTIKANEAWDITIGSPNIVVAIIDTGVQLNHPDLVDRIWTNPDETLDGSDDDGNNLIDDIHGWNFVYNTNDPSPTHGHGTHVAGIVAATINNGKGIAGVAGGATIMPLCAGTKDGFDDVPLVNAVHYAVDKGAQIINMSLGGYSNTTSGDMLFQAAVGYATSNGVVVVAAAGNDARNLNTFPIYPAGYSGVIAVSATTKSGTFDSSYSNYGNRVDIAAPGTDIASTYTESSYAADTGTSMASPHVAGAAALLLSKYPVLNPSEVYTAITQTATDKGTLGKDPYYGYGLLNLQDMLLYYYLNDTTPPTLNAITYSETATMNAAWVLQVTATDNSPISALPKVFLNTRLVPTTGSAGDWKVQQLSKISNTNTYTTTFTPPDTEGRFDFYVTLDDLHTENFVSYPTGTPTSNLISVTLLDKTPPSITFPSVLDNDYLSSKKVLSVKVTDNIAVNPATLVVTLNAGLTTLVLNASSTGISYSAPTLNIDFASVSLNVSDQTSVQIQVGIADTSGNWGQSSSLSLKNAPLAATAFTIFGPQGTTSPIINTPNPFNPQKENTVIEFQVNQDAVVTFLLYDLNANLIRKWQWSGVGYRAEPWDGKDDAGAFVPNGVYICVLKAEGNGQAILKKFKIAVINR